MPGRGSLLRRTWGNRGGGLRPGLTILACAVALLVLSPAAGSDPVPTPSISANVSGTAGNNNWYRSSVTVTWTVTDPSGITSSVGCGPTILAAETAGTSVKCDATNTYGSTASASVTIKIDKTPPDVTTGTPDRSPDVNGWYNHAVSYSFSGTDALSGVQGCSPVAYAGPDGASAAVTGTCRDQAGNLGTRAFGLRYDATPPSVAADPARPADSNGWYNHPVSVGFAGSDSVSGIDSCTSASYSGPDSDQASVAGSCRDRAGNTGGGSFALKYDSTPPTVSDVSVTSADGVDTLHWKSTSDSDTAAVRRLGRGAKKAAAKVVFQGTGGTFEDRTISNGVEYVYSVQTSDQAANVSSPVTVRALPKVLMLRKLGYVPRVAENPILRWHGTRNATYYHVQLFRGGKRILASWPLKPQLALPSTWSWAGHRYSLGPGTYRWYVWAGKGKRSLARYARLGTAAFAVVAAAPR